MRIYLFTQYYPSTFKPYFDTQFAQLVRDGHEITIFAHGRQGLVVNEVVEQLGLADRVLRYPTTLHQIPRSLPSVLRRIASGPRSVLSRVGALRSVDTPKERVTHGIRALGLPAQKPDFCLVHDLTTATWFPWLSDVYADVPVAMYYHGGENALAHRLKPENATRAFAGVHVVFTNTEFSRRHAIERGCRPDSVEVLPVGFSLPSYRPADHRAYRVGGVLRLLTAGRLSDEKGHRFALEAIASLVRQGVRDLHYTIVGSGHLQPALMAFVAEHGLEAYVEFTGAVTTKTLIQRVRECDVVLLPSMELGNWVENQACIVQEGMLMKSLIIATTTGGVPESTAPALHPFLVPPQDPVAIARAILAVRALPEQRIRELGEAGRAFAEVGYDIRQLNERMIRRILSANQRAAAVTRPGTPVYDPLALRA